MDIIGLGEAGCNIAECFRKYPQYNIYKIDVGAVSDFDFINHYDVDNKKDINTEIATRQDIFIEVIDNYSDYCECS